MGILGLQVNKYDNLESIQGKIFTIQKKLKSWEEIKPFQEDRYRLATADDNVLIPTLPFSQAFLYDMALHSDVLRTGLNTLRRSLFKRGLKIELVNRIILSIHKE